MPTRPPQHSSMPDSRTISQVSQRSSKEWVVTTAGSRTAPPRGCGCSGARPSPRSSSTCSWVSMPSEQATLMSTASWIALIAVADLRHQPLVGPADGGDDAELGGPGGRGLLGGLDQLRDVQPHRPHRRGELAGLAAEVAVLRAAAGLQADDPLDLDLRAAVLHPDGVGQLEQLGDLVVGQLRAPRPARRTTGRRRSSRTLTRARSRMSVTRSKISAASRRRRDARSATGTYDDRPGPGASVDCRAMTSPATVRRSCSPSTASTSGIPTPR